MVEALVAALVAVGVLTAARLWWRGWRSEPDAADPEPADDGPPEPGSLRRSPTSPVGGRDETEVTTAYAEGMDATEEGNRIWEEAMADWEDGNYDAAADGFGWAETQYSAAADRFERAPTASTAVWETDDGDDDGPRSAAESYETAARHMRLAAELAAEGDLEASREHVETAREALADARAGVGPDAGAAGGGSG